MIGWLDPLRRTLDGSSRTVTFFFRDDDAGWRDDRLLALLDVYVERGVPIDVAAIPVALTPDLATELRARLARAPELLAVHQHGYAHVNHEERGRRSEFGSSRSLAAQLGDIRAGRRRLEELLGPVLQPMFTPPWNRCTAETGRALLEAGVRVLSRDRTADPLGLQGLEELPVQIDWFKKRKGRPLDRRAVGELLAARAAEPAPVGVMLHHCAMEEADMAAVVELLELLATHDRARCRSMEGVLHELHEEAAA